MGDIIIKGELRPCIVTIPEKYERRFRAIDGSLKEKSKKVSDEETHNALFYRWHEQLYTVGESPMVGGCAAGRISELCGIVEYEDGTIHKVDPSCIQFIDRKIEEYCFAEKN